MTTSPTETQTKRTGAGAPVAIVGIGCRFPGGVVDTESFWKLLIEGREATGDIPKDRFDLADFYDERPATPGRVMTRRGGYLENIDAFDAGFFGISPREAERMDPQQRLLLETAWEAMEDAGVDPTALAGTNAAVYMGQWTGDFENRLFADSDAIDLAMTLGSGRYGASARLSFAFGLRGPSLSIDAACSSGLACVHLAAQSLRSGECSVALAGAANLILQPHIHIAYSQSRMMASDGRCKFGDATGDGYVRSEGVGVLVLKLLSTALADGDRIHAVVRGSAVNNDGRSSGVMGRPATLGQVELLRSAYADAGVAPTDVGYIEAHGTGTRAGDPVELGAISEVLGPGRRSGQRALVGSVKTNIGHTEASAGIAGLIKATLVLKHGQVPPSLHYNTPNPQINWDQLPVVIPRVTEPLPEPAGRRLAGVSAYGIGGTNAHVVLEAPPGAPAAIAQNAPASNQESPLLLPISARSPAALRALADSYATLFSDPLAPNAMAICRAAATRRGALEERAAFVANDASSMATQLRAFAAGDTEVAVARGKVFGKSVVAPVFVLPGQGGQWTGMARQLMAREPVFAQAMMECDAAAHPWLKLSLVDQLHLDADDPDYRMQRIELVQPALVAYGIAAARWLASLGIMPASVVGHSMGEVAAAHLAGVLSLEDAMRIICRRSALMGRTSGNGAMAMVDLSMADAQRRLAGREAALSVAVNNSPRSCVVSGDPAALQALLAELEAEGIFCRAIKVDVASHSPQMNQSAAELVNELTDASQPLHTLDAVLPLYSTVEARVLHGHAFGATYWGRNLREPVRFAETIGELLSGGARCFVELGPHPVLTTAVQQTAQSLPNAGTEVSTIAFGHRETAEQNTALAAVAGLWAAGQRVDWSRVLPAGAGDVRLPLYPWQRESLWVRQARPASRNRGGTAVAAAPIDPKQHAWLHRLQWHRVPAPEAIRAEPEVWLIPGGKLQDRSAFDDALQAAGKRVQRVDLGDLEGVLQKSANTEVGVVLLVEDNREALFEPVALLQSMLRARPNGGARLWLVTQGAVDAPVQHVAGYNGERYLPRVAVMAGAAWGVGRAIAEEHPELWGGLIDLDPTSDEPDKAVQLISELQSMGSEPQVAWRRGERFALRLVPLAERDEPIEAAPFAWRSDAAYLVTGGLGALGLRIAGAMIAQGAHRIVLLGRSSLPPRESWSRTNLHDERTNGRIAAVRALEAQGASVHLLQADTGDFESLRDALENYSASCFPPIRGVIHAAGVTEDHLLADMDRASFDRVLAPKLDGALHLDRLLPELDLFVAFSSITATLCWPGMANYVAANVGLDALMADRRARGQPALSIQWGPWQDVGLWAGASATFNTEELRRQGVQAFDAIAGVALFSALAGRSETCLAVLPADWPTLLAARRGRNLSLFTAYATESEKGASGDTTVATRLTSLPVAERVKLLTPIVRESVGRVLKLAPDRIDASKPLGNMGLNSLMAMELRNRLEAALGRALSATLAWNYPTVQALVGFLAADAHDGVVGAPAANSGGRSVPVEGAVAEDIAKVADLDDDEVARLLRRRR